MNSPNATVVSLLPFDFTETKPGLNPPNFTVKGAKDSKDGFGLTPVGIATFPIYLDSSRGSIAFPELGETVAKALVNDYVFAQILSSPDAHPGLFYVPEAATPELIKTKYKALLENAQEVQKEWFVRLVRAADDSFKRYGTHNSITDVQRVAAKTLDYKAPWVF